MRDGTPRRPARHPDTARRYTNAVHPILLAWSAGYDHPREVTRDDAKTALTTLHGEPRMTALVALRSLFTFLKKHGAIFTNPTSRIRIGAPTTTVIQPLPADLVAGTVTAAVRPADPLIHALAFIHAARPGAIRALQLEDVDQANRRLTIGGGGHVRPLDELTMRTLVNWLDYRRTRWPTTANPHLLVNVHSALFFGPVSYQWLTSTFRGGHYAKLDQFRIDRTLDEALAYPGDPLHLATMFGITDTTAIRYTEYARQLLVTAVEEGET